MGELTQRILTALVGVPVILGLIIYGDHWGTAVFTFVISVGMLIEFSNMALTHVHPKSKWWVYSAIVLLAVLYLNLALNADSVMSTGATIMAFYGVGAFAIFLFFLLTAGSVGEERLPDHVRDMVFSLFGFAYLGFVLLMLPAIRAEPHGVHWVIVFMIMVWAGDVGAYFVGKSIGKHKLYPAISPKKTIEGGVGSIASTMLVGALYCHFFIPDVAWVPFLGLSFVISVTAQAGDFFESMLKRTFDCKHSSTLLPGHGGLLDRFDGVVFSLPFMYAGIQTVI